MHEASHGVPLPPIPAPFKQPFYYAALTNCEVLFLVAAGPARHFLAGTGLLPALFDGMACASFNYQLYVGQFPDFTAVTQELELNIVAYPESAHRAEVTFEQLVMGDEQSKALGNRRVWVPCDNPGAITAGEKVFGQPHFLTKFSTKIPSLNDPSVTTWQFTVEDPKQTGAADFIFRCDADLTGAAAVTSNPSPITQYGTVDGKLIGARWNILQPFQTYLLSGEQRGRVVVRYGESEHPMRADMQALIGATRASAIRFYQSPPAAIQSRPYYP